MRITGMSRHEADEAVRQAQAHLDSEDADYWRRINANAVAGRGLWDAQ